MIFGRGLGFANQAALGLGSFVKHVAAAKEEPFYQRSQ
jgi:hypothetical protein